MATKKDNIFSRWIKPLSSSAAVLAVLQYQVMDLRVEKELLFNQKADKEQVQAIANKILIIEDNLFTLTKDNSVLQGSFNTHILQCRK